MKLAGRNGALPKMTITEAIEFMQQVGYDAIELSAIRENVIFPEISEDYMIRHILECVQKKPGFTVSALSCHANYATNDYVYSVQERLLRAAHRYGTDIVIMSTFVPYAERENNAKELYEKLVNKTRSLCRVAQQEGVHIAIEMEPNTLLHDVRGFLSVAEAVGSPMLKTNLDIGHLFLSEPDLNEAIAKIRNYTVHGHIDNMCRGEHCHKLPWEGDIDLADACRCMKTNGFDGVLSLDLYLQDYAAVSPACVRYIKEKVFSSL